MDVSDQVERGANGPLRVIFMRNRCAPHRHHRVTDELFDGSSVASDDLCAQLEVPTQSFPYFLRVPAFREGCEADEVGEQDGNQTPLSDRLQFCRACLASRGELAAALPAEARLRFVHRAAVRAGGVKRRAAAVAK